MICGPTATGKTKLAVNLAKLLDGEVISADSMQIYQKLDIGTAKVTVQEMNSVPHHLVDIIEPDVSYSVADYVSQAKSTVSEICERGHYPLLCGGTGLYISSFINGVNFEVEKPDLHIRRKLQNELQLCGREAMYVRLKNIDPLYAETLHTNNTVRVLRAIELFEQTGKKMSEQIQNSLPLEKPYNTIVLYLTYRNRETLYNKIDSRVDEMVNSGILQEAKLVFDNRNSFLTAASAIGYKEFFPYFENTKTLDECTEKLKQATRRYAKRQMTWFRSIEEKHTICIDEVDALSECKNILRDYSVL